MKKIIFILFALVGVITFSSCNVSIKKELELQTQEIAYKGHTYIIFYSKNYMVTSPSVVHSPDCEKCKNK